MLAQSCYAGWCHGLAPRVMGCRSTCMRPAGCPLCPGATYNDDNGAPPREPDGRALPESCHHHVYTSGAGIQSRPRMSPGCMHGGCSRRRAQSSRHHGTAEGWCTCAPGCRHCKPLCTATTPTTARFGTPASWSGFQCSQRHGAAAAGCRTCGCGHAWMTAGCHCTAPKRTNRSIHHQWA